MSNDAKLKVSGVITYPWNPFQDLTSCRITGEEYQTDANNAGLIVLRAGPFFSRNISISLKDSSRPLSFDAGDFTFVYPFGAFNEKYNRLAWGAIQIKDVSTPVTVVVDYDTIGGNFVLSDLAYAEAVANAQVAPRTTDWNNIVNLPLTWPADPHDQPASDTMNYGDLIVWMKSYMDAITQNPDASWMSRFEQHLKDDLKKAHKATLGDLGIEHLKDWAMAQIETDIPGNSTELLTNVAFVKALIRGFSTGQWQ
jgi:hypothetical protein